MRRRVVIAAVVAGFSLVGASARADCNTTATAPAGTVAPSTAVTGFSDGNSPTAHVAGFSDGDGLEAVTPSSH